MPFETELKARSQSKCELSGTQNNLQSYKVSGGPESVDGYIYISETCINQIESDEQLDTNLWRCLNESMWSEVPAVQVMAYRLLHRLNNEAWAQDLLDIFYLDDETLAWAKAGISDNKDVVHLDSNGNVLSAGDTVVITQTLKVKGSSVTAKRGTSVRNISLVHDNPEQIEGRVEGQQIVILTKFVKKAK